MKRQRGQLALGDDIKKHLVQKLLLFGKWGYPLDKYDLCCIVKGYLDRRAWSMQSSKIICQVLSIGFPFFFASANVELLQTVYICIVILA